MCIWTRQTTSVQATCLAKTAVRTHAHFQRREAQITKRRIIKAYISGSDDPAPGQSARSQSPRSESLCPESPLPESLRVWSPRQGSSRAQSQRPESARSESLRSESPRAPCLRPQSPRFLYNVFKLLYIVCVQVVQVAKQTFCP